MIICKADEVHSVNLEPGQSEGLWCLAKGIE